MNRLKDLKFKVYTPSLIKSEKDGKRIIEGYASVSDVIDRQNEVITHEALAAAEKDLLENATVFYEHKHSDLPVGKVTDAKVDDKGLKVKVELTRAKFADDLWQLIEDNILNSFSIGGMVRGASDKKTKDGKVYRQIDELTLYEVSIVGLPANSEAKFEMAKSLNKETKDLDLPAINEVCTLNQCITKALHNKSEKKLTFDQILAKDLTTNKLIPEKDKKEDKKEEPKKETSKKEIEKGGETISKPEETEDYIRIPVRDCKITATITLSEERGITALYCGKIKKIATYIFAKAKGWTMASAQKWVREHDAGKSKKENKESTKSVISFNPYTKAPINEKWDAGKEVKEADIDDLKKMCTWYDSEKPDVKASYKLPHHKVSGYAVVWNAVKSAMGILFGARGGVDIPEADRKGVYNHLAKHYKQFDKEVPEFKSYSEEELKTLFSEEKARGEGQGQGKPRQGDGGTDICICPKCGEEVPHTRGTPCNASKCPKCGTALVGKAKKEEPWKAELVTIKEALSDISERLGKLEDIIAQDEAPKEPPVEEVPAGEEPREQKNKEKKVAKVEKPKEEVKKPKKKVKHEHPPRKSLIVAKSPYGDESQPKEETKEKKLDDQDWSPKIFK